MLKIKDSFDLNKLKKYGFKYYAMIWIKEIVRGEDDLQEKKTIYIEELTRNISIRNGLFNVDIELDTIYDLIQDGITEKV